VSISVLLLWHDFRAHCAANFFVEVFLFVCLYPEELTKNAAHKHMLQRDRADDLEYISQGCAQSTDQCQQLHKSEVDLLDVDLFEIEADRRCEWFD